MGACEGVVVLPGGSGGTEPGRQQCDSTRWNVAASSRPILAHAFCSDSQIIILLLLKPVPGLCPKLLRLLPAGEDFDQRVMEYFIKLIKKKYKTDISKDARALQKLRREAERAKRALSSQHQVRACSAAGVAAIPADAAAVAVAAEGGRASFSGVQKRWLVFEGWNALTKCTQQSTTTSFFIHHTCTPSSFCPLSLLFLLPPPPT